MHYREGSILQREFNRIAEEKIQIANESDNNGRDTNKKYFEDRKQTHVSQDLRDGDEFSDLKVMSTPGHSPDQICLVLDDFIFTGDHILPEITPHPTSKMVFRDTISENLPEFLQDPSELYGLGTYLKSLGRVIELGNSYTVLPAHRLYNKSNFNWQGVERAGDILKHHEKRLDQMLKKLQGKNSNLEETTKGIFERSKLLGSNLYPAMSEIVAHLEFLEDTEDISIDASGQISMQGDGTNYKNYIAKLLDPK
jgi:glyoxylase-like metal-dependent hydrolase (beta-lactamase superfamily II)